MKAFIVPLSQVVERDSLSPRDHVPKRTRADRLEASERRRAGALDVGDRVRMKLDPIAHGLIIKSQAVGQRNYLVTVRWDFPYGGRNETRIRVQEVERIFR